MRRILVWYSCRRIVLDLSVRNPTLQTGMCIPYGTLPGLGLVPVGGFVGGVVPPLHVFARLAIGRPKDIWAFLLQSRPDIRMLKSSAFSFIFIPGDTYHNVRDHHHTNL